VIELRRSVPQPPCVWNTFNFKKPSDAESWMLTRIPKSVGAGAFLYVQAGSCAYFMSFAACAERLQPRALLFIYPPIMLSSAHFEL
jgi:hypothetical protein